MLTKEQIKYEIENVWNLNENTTLRDIKEYYYEITGLENMSICNMLSYCYAYILDSMYIDDDITLELRNELYNEYISKNGE